jgi:hypothetical protein
MVANNNTPEFVVKPVEHDGRQEWAVYDDMEIYDDLGQKVPAAVYPTQAQAEQFIEKYRRQDMAMAEIATLAKSALAGWLADTAVKYNLGFKDLNELVYFAVDDALTAVCPI